ncbi:hypothetical protein GA0070617_5038 [Micromonospora yangpuensis]|uniref:Uncharacterized protein n=1 Tax=Micromonospora yangpuensis TaxID=683228 RepID=A0A1C6V942_9ACTN|nr:hypothetical protein GA0070617_5038 [Micromonospora yangpuensis]
MLSAASVKAIWYAVTALIGRPLVTPSRAAAVWVRACSVSSAAALILARASLSFRNAPASPASI